jgi:hypothetical protein
MGYLVSLSKPATVHWLDASEWGLLVFGLAVFVGIWGEIKLEHGSRNFKVAEYIVLFGILGELIADGGVFFFSTQLQIISDSENAALGVKASEANERAGKALDQAKLLEASNKQLGIDLELEKQKTARFQKEADEARLTLENRVRTQGPRYFLLRGAAPKMAKELSRFHGQPAALLICGMYKTERETLETWGSLANILGPDTVNGVKGAGWKMVRGNPIWDKCFLSMQGISVIVSSESPKATRDAAEALSIGLKSVLPPYNKNPWVLDPVWTRQKIARSFLDKDDPERLALENPDTIVVFIGEHPPQ